MAYVIAEPCVDRMEQTCVTVCPVDCIGSEPDDRKFYIDPDDCIDCGACESECPRQAIFPAESLPPEWAHFARVDATWHRDRSAARTCQWPPWPV